MRYTFSPLALFFQNVEDVFIIYNDEILCIENCTDDILKGIALIKRGCTDTQLIQELGKEETTKLINSMQDFDLIRINYKNEFSENIVERQIYFFDTLSQNPNEIQKNLQSKRICILGMGGVGSIVFQHLIGAGIKSFIIIDSDIIEVSNLNRQFMFNSTQINQLKVEAAKEYAKNIDANIDVSGYAKFINSIEDLYFLKENKIDFFVCAADLPPGKIQNIVGEFCKENKIPFSFGSVGINFGSWGPLIIPDKSICCYDCFRREEERLMSDVEKRILKCANEVIKASFGPTNTVISAFLAKDIIMFLSGSKDIQTMNTRTYLNFQTMETTRVSGKSCKCKTAINF